MNQITIHNLDEKVLLRLKELAWQSGQGLEDYLRCLLTDVANPRNRRELRCFFDTIAGQSEAYPEIQTAEVVTMAGWVSAPTEP